MKKQVKSIFVSILYALMFIITQMIVSLIGIFMISFCISQNQGGLVNISAKVLDMISANIILISIIGNFVFLIIAFIICKRKKGNVNIKFSFKCMKSSYFLLSLITIVCFSLLWNCAFEIIPILRSIGTVKNTVQGNWIVYIMAIYIIAPITEEICFRQIIISKLRYGGISELLTLIISASLFGLAHFMTGNPMIVLFAFIGGLVFSICYILTGSLTATIIVHIFGNLCDKVWHILELFSIETQYLFIILLSVCTIFMFVILIKAIFKKETYLRS